MRQKIGRKPKFIIVKLCFLLLSIMLALSGCSKPENPVPKPIQELKLGSNSSQVKTMLAANNSEDFPGRRSRVVWRLPKDAHYEDVEFHFTEKDRLFIIRFNLKESRRDEYHNLRKAFFSTYDIQSEEPMRLRVKDSDVLLYSPNDENGDVFFLEFTNKLDNKKSLELFSRKISAQDKAAFADEQKKLQELDSQKQTGESSKSETESKTDAADQQSSDPEKSITGGEKNEDPVSGK